MPQETAAARVRLNDDVWRDTAAILGDAKALCALEAVSRELLTVVRKHDAALARSAGCWSVSRPRGGIGESRAGRTKSVPRMAAAVAGRALGTGIRVGPDSLRAVGEITRGPSPSPRRAWSSRSEQRGEITLPVLWSGMAS